jgi:hypothetical protein
VLVPPLNAEHRLNLIHLWHALWLSMSSQPRTKTSCTLHFELGVLFCNLADKQRLLDRYSSLVD